MLSGSSGSMTTTNSALYSGAITVSATTAETGAVVTITRKKDVTPPPPPVLIDINQWRYPGIEIIKPGYQDADTTIASYQVLVDEVIRDITATPTDDWLPTVLNPFTPPKTVRVRDLPEGSYSLSLRAIDIAGNKSEWTKPVKVSIDRTRPTVTNEFSIQAVNGNQISLSWTGAKDGESGLCQTNLIGEEGLVVQSSTAKTAPTITVSKGASISAHAQVFDCAGNGVTGDLSLTNILTSADKSTRTGKWSAAGSSYGAGALKCTGKCTASFSIKGRNDFLVGTGTAVVTLGPKTLATITDSKLIKTRLGARVDVGTTRKVVRISGRNFVLVAAASVAATFTNQKSLDRLVAINDSSLVNNAQVNLAKLGFNPGDFSQEWTVLPMRGGTTLDFATLDLCNATFASEKNRRERRQVVVTKEGSPYTFLSTEVVRYSSSAAAQSAQKELAQVLAQCQSDGGYKDTTGALLPYTFTEITNIPDGLAPKESRILVRATIDSGNRARQLLGIYQFNGAMFTGLYVITSSETALTDAQVATWLQVAVTMANRLKN
jgi:hypothetical protein